MTDTPTEHGWYVDDRCTNCDVARRLAPGLIAEEGGRSVVVRRPRDAEDERRLHAAAFACHTRSVRPPSGHRLDPALDPYPMPLDATVYLCGHNAPMTAAANSYLLRRPAGNLLMVDTPRWSETPATRFEWLLPGHGDRARLPAAETAGRMRALATRTAAPRPRPVDFTAMRW
ncbi:4Fe-4S domain-containing protein [Streptomyces niveus]|uniref:4Fe-4S domain-containing protein n=1 Tax=Streptomyces niveus TaxID=193462 RepID=UPI0036C3072D